MKTANFTTEFGICAMQFPSVFYGLGALRALRDLTHGKKVLVVSDESCIKAGALALSHIAVCDTVILDESAKANEKVVAQVRQSICECNVVVAIGTKTIVDIVRAAAYYENVLYIVVATAPSSSSFVSEYADIWIETVKKKIHCAPPIAVVADTEIFLKSPATLKSAGIGNLQSLVLEAIERQAGAMVSPKKKTSEGDESNEKVPQLVEIQIALDCFKELNKNSLHSEKGIESLFLALCAMQLHKESREETRGKTGSARKLSDLFYANCLAETRIIEGETLGLAVSFLIELVEHISSRLRSKIVLTPLFSFKAWEKKVKEVFPPKIAKKMIHDESRYQTNAPKNRQKRILTTYAFAANLLKLLASQKLFSTWLALYQKEGGITSYKKLGLTKRHVKNAILFGKDLSRDFSFLQLASDLNILTEFIQEI